MRMIRILPLVLVGALVASSGWARDDDRDRDRDRSRDSTSTQDRDRDDANDRDRDRDRDRDEEMYGSQLMTDPERSEYRMRMRDAKTAQERDELRSEHHEQMMMRAKERGVSLPDSPPIERGPGSGRGPGR